MLRPRVLLLLALCAVPATAAPIRIMGRVLHPPEDVQVELRPWAVEHAEALRRLKGEAVPPLASAKPRADGSFALQVPDSGFYSVVARAEGHVAMERSVRFVAEDTEIPPVELAPASPLEVKAVGADGQPLAGVTIQALPVQESGEWHAAERRAVTDAEGRAVFLRAEGEALTLYIINPGRYATASTSPTGASQTLRFPALRTRMVELRYPDGKPAAGALVRLAARGWPYGLAAEDGRIPLPVPEKEEIGFFAEDSEGLRAEVVPGQDKETSVFTLRPPAAVVGWVVDAFSHAPIPGALVWNGGRAWTRTGADGAFALLAPSGGRGQVEATAAGRTVHAEPWTENWNAPVTLLLALRGGAIAVGRVVDEESRPVAGARVTLLTRAGAPLFQVTSDSDGRFRLFGAIAGWFSLWVARQGFAMTALYDVLVPEEPRVDLGEIRLRAGGAIEGIVTDARGRPVDKAWIGLTPYDPHGSGLTGPDGRFRIEDLPRGTRFDLRVKASGLLPAEVAGVEVPTDRPLRIRLDLPRTLAGRVVGEDGSPVAGASVSSTGEAARNQTGESVRADPEGRFVLPNVSPGKVHVQASAPGYRTGKVQVEVPEEGEAEPVEIVLEPGTSLEGRVLDSRGEPVHEKYVEAAIRKRNPGTFGSGVTDVQGSYEIVDLEPGPCEVEVSPLHQGPPLRATVELQPGRNRLDLRFPAGFEVAGRVVDDRGEPLPGASVALQSLRPDQSGWPFQAVSAADGSFVFAEVADGEYQLAASRPGFGPTTHPGEVRVEGAPVGGLELRLSPGAVIRGRILGLRPEESRSLSVHASLDPTGFPLQAAVSPGGGYRFEDMAPGEWHVVARTPSGIIVEGTAEVAEGVEEVVLDLELPEVGGDLRSDDRGEFEMLRIPAGTYRMRIEAEGFGPAESRVVVAPGGTVHLDVALGVSP